MTDTLAEQQLLAAAERLANGDDVYDQLKAVQLDGLLDEHERATRVYLSLVRLHRTLYQAHSTAASARQPEPEPESEPEPSSAPRSTPPRTDVDGTAAESVGSVAAFQNVVHPCEPDTASKFKRRDNPPAQDVPAAAPDPCSGAVGGEPMAGMQVIPRLQLGEGLLGQDASSGPRTRSSRRLSARLSLESTRGTPNNTGRSLRSVRLHVQDDTVRPATVEFGVQSGSGHPPSASRQLQLVAARAAGVFMARRSAGIVRNIREKRSPTGCEATCQIVQRGMGQHSVNWRSLHCIVDLMVAVTTGVLDSSRTGMRCGLDMDVVQLPINALVAHLMSTAHRAEGKDDELAMPTSYRAAVLRLFCQIGSIVDICTRANDAAANVALGPDTPPSTKAAHPNRTAVMAVLPGGTASDETTPLRPATIDSAKAGPGSRTDRVVLRLARILQGLVYADTLDRHRISRCLFLLTEYTKLRSAHRALHTLGLIKKLLRQIAGRTLDGREFDASIHLSSVELVHSLLALSEIVLEPSTTDWLVMERSTASWISAYCCWVLTMDAGVFNFSYSVERLQSQALRYISRCAHAWCERSVDGTQSTAGTADESSEMMVCSLISSALSHDHAASINTGFERAKAALELIAEVASAGRHLHCVLGSVSEAMYCACTIFLRAYFQPTPDTEKETLCCLSIKTMLRLLEVDSTCAVKQIEQLRLVDIVVGEISGEHLFDHKQTALNFTTVSNGHAGGYDGLVSDSVAEDSTECAFDSDDEGYESDLSDSLDSRYSGGQNDSYSCSDDFTAAASTKALMPSLQLSGFTGGAHALDASAMDVDPAAARDTSLAGAADIDFPVLTFRDGRRIYASDELHLLVVQLIMALVVTSDGLLSPGHWSRTPAAEGKPNLHDLLYDHLNHARNSHLIPELEKRVLCMHSGEGGACLLKLLCADMFDTSSYVDRTRLASGANATVYRCNHAPKLPNGSHALEPQVVALKVIDRSSSANHFCPLPDVFSEIRVLMRLRGCEGACQLIDYGVGPDSYYIALKCYTTSLRKWRLHQDTRSDFQRHQDQLLPLYLRIYRRILLVTDKLATRNIIHFDIKCDNVLMSPTDDGDLVDFWNPTPTVMPQHDVVLADFGVGKLVGNSEGMHTVRNRGTECIKSPEMILADRFVTSSQYIAMHWPQANSGCLSVSQRLKQSSSVLRPP